MKTANCAFVSDFGLPDDPRELDEVLPRTLEAISNPRSTSKAREKWLMGGGAPAAVDWSDSKVFSEVAAAAAVARTTDAMTRHIARLIMPDAYSAARAELIDILGLDEPSDLAELLDDINDRAPDAVTALLELRIADAHAAAEHLEQSLRHDIAYLLVQMSKVRAVFVGRCLAAGIGQELHEPFGWEPLDTINPGKPSRVGAIGKKAREQLELLDKVLGLYREGRHATLRTTHPKLSVFWGDDPKLVLTLGVVGRDAPLSDVKFLHGSNAHWCALIQLAIWQREYGDGLEDFIETKIAEITTKLNRLRSGFEGFFNAHQQHDAMRASSLHPIPPLDRLGVIANYIVAWTVERRGAACGAARLVEWLQGGRTEPRPAPSIYRNHERLSHDVFALLRFACVDDEDVLPSALRQVIDPTTSRSTYIRNQDDALRTCGRAYSFDELWDGYKQADRPESEPKRKADKLCGRKNSMLTRRTAKALADVRYSYEAGFLPN